MNSTQNIRECPKSKPATTEEVKQYFMQMRSQHQKLQKYDNNSKNKHSVKYSHVKSASAA